ncbi:probable inactive serine/threonine-protein kinase bub1 [Rhodamnia argentea]|uniref:Probable inactive serine/threonine-protein kinase bub1 n=1 Tax=Rhodamnia argentea TaxID=178133 RepID=A0A8B8NLH6_9MYRT|nr:probable inactive serine/threonine-protein kinase bub1 [Rhodamnia argentea]
MAETSTTESPHDDLFSSVISDIRTYTGDDPLLPWIRGIRRMKERLPLQVLKEKLPRFLQKCAEKFQSDRRYRNDLRYLRVWLQLMDYVDDPKVLLRAMEMNRIGMKRSLFYQAYALYFEKMKKFEEADKIYHLGVQNLAEPADELQKSYEQFLHRLERHTIKRIQHQERRANKENICHSYGRHDGTYHDSNTKQSVSQDKNVDTDHIREEKSQNGKPLAESRTDGIAGKEWGGRMELRKTSNQQLTEEKKVEEPAISYRDSVAVKLVDTALIGKPEEEDACHHGLVEPTINMKEAMNAINSMFREPIVSMPVGRGSLRRHKREKQSSGSNSKAFVDENLEKQVEASKDQNREKSCSLRHTQSTLRQPQEEGFQIYIDEEGNDDGKENGDLEQDQAQNFSASHVSGFVFPRPNDLAPESSNELGIASSSRGKFREDTVVGKFVGSTILDEPVVENVCHHGLVEPTINLKEAMEDINNMFGKPIEFVRTRRSKKREKLREQENCSGFLILPDDELESEQFEDPGISAAKAFDRQSDVGFSILSDDVKHPEHKVALQPSRKPGEIDLFEPTVFTKEAMDDISKMFGMPLDF